MEKFETDTNIKSFDIYNALNLIQEDLGEIYKEKDFNPLGEEYKLTEEFVLERFENGKQKKEVLTPIFLNGEKETLEAFANSANNAQEIIAGIDAQIASPSTPEAVKTQLKKIKILLVCRVELLNHYKTTFKKKKNDLKMYTNVLSIDWKTADLYEETFKKQFDVQIAINAFLEFAKANSKNNQKESADQKLIQKAKEIIKNNLLAKQKEETLISKPAESAKAQTPIAKETTIAQKSHKQTATFTDEGMSL